MARLGRDRSEEAQSRAGRRSSDRGARRRPNAQRRAAAQARPRSARRRDFATRRVRGPRRAGAWRDRRAGEAPAMTVWELIAAIAACVAVQAFFAASEIAVVSADEVKVRAESEGGSARSHALGALLANRDRLLALTLTSNNVATVL